VLWNDPVLNDTTTWETIPTNTNGPLRGTYTQILDIIDAPPVYMSTPVITRNYWATGTPQNLPCNFRGLALVVLLKVVILAWMFDSQ
jgi:hypothetical protein